MNAPTKGLVGTCTQTNLDLNFYLNLINKQQAHNFRGPSLHPPKIEEKSAHVHPRPTCDSKVLGKNYLCKRNKKYFSL